MADKKYGNYVLTEPRMKEMEKKLNFKPTFGLSQDHMVGIKQFDTNFNFVAIIGPHVLGDPPHKHDCDEILFFISADPDDPTYLGGEVEIALGDEWEKQVIDTSAVICLPAGVAHCPVYVRKVDRPFYFGHLLMAGSYGSSAMAEADQ